MTIHYSISSHNANLTSKIHYTDKEYYEPQAILALDLHNVVFCLLQLQVLKGFKKSLKTLPVFPKQLPKQSLCEFVLYMYYTHPSPSWSCLEKPAKPWSHLKILQYQKGPDRSVHQILTVLATINPEKGLLWDPDPRPSSPSRTYA